MALESVPHEIFGIARPCVAPVLLRDAHEAHVRHTRPVSSRPPQCLQALFWWPEQLGQF